MDFTEEFLGISLFVPKTEFSIAEVATNPKNYSGQEIELYGVVEAQSSHIEDRVSLKSVHFWLADDQGNSLLVISPNAPSNYGHNLLVWGVITPLDTCLCETRQVFIGEELGDEDFKQLEKEEYRKTNDRFDVNLCSGIIEEKVRLLEYRCEEGSHKTVYYINLTKII